MGRPFIRIYRDEIPSCIIKENKDALALYFVIKQHAAFYEHKQTFKGKILNLRKMDAIFSIRDLAKELNLTIYKTRKELDFLKSLDMIYIDTSEGFSRITVLETVQKNNQTPSNSIIERELDGKTEIIQTVPSNPQTDDNSGIISDREEKHTMIQTPSLNSQTGDNPGLEGLQADYNHNNQTHYNKTIANREKKSNSHEKKENNTKEKKSVVDDLINYINFQLVSNGNRAIELLKDHNGHVTFIKRCIDNFESPSALKMEIRRYFDHSSPAEKYNTTISTLSEYLLKKPKYVDEKFNQDQLGTANTLN